MVDPGRISVLLVCDRLLIVEGLRFLIDSTGDLAVVDTASTGEDALRLAARGQADVIVMDLDLRGEDPLTLIRRIVTAAPGARILGLTASSRHERHWSAALAGARGVVPRERPPAVLLQGIRRLHAGELWFERQVVGSVGTRNADSSASELRVRVH